MSDKKKKWLILFIVCVAMAILLTSILVLFIINNHSSADKIINEAYNPPVADRVSLSDYQSPIDFDKLISANKDIYAWIEIPDTKVNYPVLQRKYDDSFYLNHDIDGTKKARGALFTESMYNTDDFEDTVTVIYGHDMKNGTMFGGLQKYSNEKYFKEHSIIKIYLPNQTNIYTVFVAVPFSNKHILYSWDFDKEGQLDNFFRNIKSTKSLLANYNNEVETNSESKIIILSTCLKSNSSKRFLVMGVLTEIEK